MEKQSRVASDFEFVSRFAATDAEARGVRGDGMKRCRRQLALRAANKPPRNHRASHGGGNCKPARFHVAARDAASRLTVDSRVGESTVECRDSSRDTRRVTRP